MADPFSQPKPLFSRDLKYMLDARYAAAPLRRSHSKITVIAVLTGILAVALWGGARMLAGAGETPVSIAQPYDHPAPAVLVEAKRKREYTQPEPQVAKTIESGPAIASNPHPSHSRDTTPVEQWQSHNVRRGDTLGGIFSRFSINIGLASAIVEDDVAAALEKLMPGHEMSLGFGPDGALVRLRYQVSRMQEIVVQLEDSQLLAARQRQIPTSTRERTASRTIGSSLFLAASRAGVSDRLIMQLVSVFGWDIDFALDIQPGDRFSILYEELFRDSRVVGTGDILAAEFVNDGAVYRAVRHIDDSGRKEYFDLEGNNLRGTFLKTPMRVSRITSGFSKRRYHPVLKKWRAHRGVDYGAPSGTPVLATGDGRVRSIGRNGGYGNTVVLKHGGQYSTLYAHLSGFEKGLKRGSKVAQGDVIGYVGATGLVTGPHLHYEFRVNGRHRDPLTYDTPRAQPIAERYRETFLAMARQRISQLAETRAEQVASR